MSNKHENFGKSLLTEADLVALRTGAQRLQYDGGEGVALGALVRACTAQYEVLPPHVLGALCAVAEYMKGPRPALPAPRVELQLTALPVHELFALPIGSQFIVRWAKDDNFEDNFRLPYTRQVIAGFDASGDILTEDGYEWSKREVVKEGSNELDTGRGSAYFFRYDPNDMKVIT